MISSEPVVVTRGTTRLVGERWPGDDPVVVLLHAGVADRRSWYDVAPRLADHATVVAYDRRGFGETRPSAEPFSHVDDLLAVLDEVADGPAWLVGSSAGGGVALDASLVAPARVAGLALLAPAVGGAPESSLDPATKRLDALLDRADAAGDLEEVNRLETWVWLDGPAQPEGRVTGPGRDLALAMNAAVLRNGVPEGAGASGLDTWSHLDEVRIPATVACGDLDVPALVARSRALADRLPNARHRTLAGTAHLPYLERPDVAADLVVEALHAAGVPPSAPA